MTSRVCTESSEGNVTEDYTSEGFGEAEESDPLGVNPSEEEGPDIPVLDDVEPNNNNNQHGEVEDSFEEISTGKREMSFFFNTLESTSQWERVGIPVAEDQRTAYIGLVGGVLSIVVLLLGTGLVVFLRRRKSRHGKQVAVMLPGGGSSNAGLILNKMPIGGTSESSAFHHHHINHHIHSTPTDKRMTLLSLKQMGKTNSLMAPSARDGFYGPVMTHESDSDTSSFYHEPYQHNSSVTQYPRGITFQRGMYSSIASQSDPEYGCLIQKDHQPLVLTPKGLHSTNVYHKNNAQTLPPAMPLPRPPLSMSLLRGESSVTSPQTTTSFVNPPENYYAITDIIHVSSLFSNLKTQFRSLI